MDTVKKFGGQAVGAIERGFASASKFTFSWLWLISSILVRLILAPFKGFISWYSSLWRIFLVQPLQKLFGPAAKSFRYLNDRKWKWISNIIVLGVITWSSFVISVMMYYAFYQVMIPKLAHQIPLYFQFRNHTVSPYADVDIEPYFYFYPNQEYDVFINLEMPESQPNIEAGMFMVTLEGYYSEYNGVGDKYQMVYQSARPAILRYRSPLIRLFWSLTYALPLTFGIVEEYQHIHVRLVEALDKQFSKAVVYLSSHQLQVYSASLHFHVQLYGVRYLMYNWFVTSFVIITSMFFNLLMLFGLYLWGILRYEDESTTIETSFADMSSPFTPGDSGFGTFPLINPEKLESTEIQRTDSDEAVLSRKPRKEKVEPSSEVESGKSESETANHSGDEPASSSETETVDEEIEEIVQKTPEEQEPDTDEKTASPTQGLRKRSAPKPSGKEEESK